MDEQLYLLAVALYPALRRVGEAVRGQPTQEAQ